MIKLMLKHVRNEVILLRSYLILGIKVSNTPGAVVASTADVGIFLLIGAIRNFNHGIFELRRGLPISQSHSNRKGIGRIMSGEDMIQKAK
jgi:lactate dehydrogenase-like 2-hydroxyacid dehydrogenase